MSSCHGTTLYDQFGMLAGCIHSRYRMPSLRRVKRTTDCHTGLHLLRLPQSFLAAFQSSTPPNPASYDLHTSESIHLDLSATGRLSGHLSRTRSMVERDLLGPG